MTETIKAEGDEQTSRRRRGLSSLQKSLFGVSPATVMGPV